MTCIFPYIVNVIIPNDELIFFKGVKTTNQHWYVYLSMYVYLLIYLSIYQSINISINPSIWICLSNYLSNWYAILGSFWLRVPSASPTFEAIAGDSVSSASWVVENPVKPMGGWMIITPFERFFLHQPVQMWRINHRYSWHVKLIKHINHIYDMNSTTVTATG
jgi:hypothetical protein